jgi:hypothetical protein
MAPLPCPFASRWPLTVGIILLAGERGTKYAFLVLVTTHHRLLVAGGSLLGAGKGVPWHVCMPQST